MRVFLAGVSSETQYTKALDTIWNDLITREGDELAFKCGSVGWASRMELCNTFLERPQFDALFMVDMDMKFPPDALERLRSHNVDMVSGHYFKRQVDPMVSIIQVEKDGELVPLRDIPTEGLHLVVTSGMGCLLVKREVIEAVAKIPEIVHPFMVGALPSVYGWDMHFGQDIRFFLYAKMLGYQLWLDASVECPHACTVWLTKKLYDILRPHQEEEWQKYLDSYEWAPPITETVSKNWSKFTVP